MDPIIVVGIIAAVIVLISLFGYKSFRRKYAGIIGVGGSYLILLGLMLLVTGIVQLINGAPSKTELVITLVLAVLAMLYMVFVIVARCKTVAQRILLPLVAIFIAVGFIWKLLAAIVFRTPLNSGIEEPAATFPQKLRSPEGDDYILVNATAELANYSCSKTGATVQFHAADFEDGNPTGWY